MPWRVLSSLRWRLVFVFFALVFAVLCLMSYAALGFAYMAEDRVFQARLAVAQAEHQSYVRRDATSRSTGDALITVFRPGDVAGSLTNGFAPCFG